MAVGPAFNATCFSRAIQLTKSGRKGGVTEQQADYERDLKEEILRERTGGECTYSATSSELKDSRYVVNTVSR